MRVLLFAFSIFFFLHSCIPDFSNEESAKEETSVDVIKKFYPDGTLKTEVPVENKKKNGTAKNYYKDGTLRQSVDYQNGIKNGEARTYYENGKLYQVSRYKFGQLHGIREKYHPNGQLMFEAPYYEGNTTVGLKEYLLDGSLKKKYPVMSVTEEDRILLDGTFILHLAISDGNRRVTYYIGDLNEHGQLSPGARKLETYSGGKARLEFKLTPGMFIMEKIPITAVIKTLQGNDYFVVHHHNLAIENR